MVIRLIYDADAKEQITDRNARFSTLLPGKRNPEEDIINSMTPDNGAEFVKSLGVVAQIRELSRSLVI